VLSARLWDSSQRLIVNEYLREKVSRKEDRF